MRFLNSDGLVETSGDLLVHLAEGALLLGVLHARGLRLEVGQVQISASLVLVLDVHEDLLGELVQRDVVLPSPVLEGVLVIQAHGPRLGNSLSSRAGVVRHIKAGNQLFDFLVELLGSEADSGEVVSGAVKALARGSQELDSCLDAVVDVDHGELLLLLEPALV